MKKLALTTLCTALIFGASTAHADSLYANDANSIAEAIQAKGYKALVTEDNVGDPKIESSAEGAQYEIYFYGCEPECNTIQFSAGFDLDDPAEYRLVNAFNREMLFGQAYLDDEGDPFITYPINMIDGLSRANFDESFDDWVDLLEEFTDTIDWN